ncbi:MAG: acetyl-CoA acetyltransferase [Bacillota bacterium]
MASNGIANKIAIIGMGCTKFGENWDKSPEDMMVDAAYEALEDAGLTPDDIDAYWIGTQSSGMAGVTLSVPLKIQNKPVTRVENFCATGSESFRAACYAVASGAYDIAMAVGVEKLKDSGFSGLAGVGMPDDGTRPDISAPAGFSMLAPAYFSKYGIDPKEGKQVLARIAYKNHKNGALNPKAQYQKEVSMDTILNSPPVAGYLGVFDCSGVADGSAAAIICRAEDAKKYREDPIYVKALSIVAGSGGGGMMPDFDFTSVRETVAAAADAYAQCGITNPREQISMAEVHDCFTPTELVIYEDLGFAERGHAWKDVLNGEFDIDGRLPVNPDGGLKSFGHPIGASGIRMLYEMYKQLQGKAGKRQLKDPKLGLTHNLGGVPWSCVAFVSIVGKDL